MNLEELNALVNSPSDLVKEVQKYKTEIGQEDALKQLHPETHSVMDTALRKDKVVQKPNGQQDANGNDLMDQSLEKVARLPLSRQKRIVNTAATFLTGAPIELQAKPTDDAQQKLYDMVVKTWQDNKLDFKTRTIAKAMMAQKECAELWYLAPAEEGYWGELGNAKSQLRLRFSILTPDKGNSFYPIFDKFGDLLAFGRGYTLDEAGEKTEYLELYTADMKYVYFKGEQDWQQDTEQTKPNVIGKIPVVYYQQERTEWQDVQPLIERLETLLSNFADTNDYFGSPMVVVSGAIKGFATKGESGKVLETENGGDVKYLTWDHAPEAVRLEIETLKEEIQELTSTPNITFKEMKGLGAVSGIALKLMFLDAHGKAKDKQDGDYGECVQRRINLLKAACGKINVEVEKAQSLSITPKFGLFLPDNELEAVELEGKKVENLLRATGERPVLSQESALQHNPLVENSEEELGKLKAQEEASELRIA